MKYRIVASYNIASAINLYSLEYRNWKTLWLWKWHSWHQTLNQAKIVLNILATQNTSKRDISAVLYAGGEWK